MQSDEVIWQVINQQFCSFKIKTPTKNFCRNEWNATGLCNRQSCPLANSRYATVRERDGVLYLYQKTVERAHCPAKLWSRIKLSKNYTKALEQLDEALEFWPNYQVHRCKQRLTKLTQMLTRMRKLRLKTQTKLVPIKKKLDRREARREAKAEAAALLDQTIEKELLSRLKSGVYGKMYDDVIINERPEAFLNAIKQVKGAQADEEVDHLTDGELEMEEMGEQTLKARVRDDSSSDDGSEASQDLEFVEFDDSSDGEEADNLTSDGIEYVSESDAETDEDIEDGVSISSDESCGDDKSTTQRKSSQAKRKLEGKKRNSFVEIEYEVEGATRAVDTN